MKPCFTRRFAPAFVLAFLLASFCATAPAVAQDTEGYPRVGVGVSVADVSTVFADANEESGFIPLPTVLVPIDVSETFRVEPLIGYTRLSSERPSFDGSETIEFTTNVLRLGIGAFGGLTRDDTHLYYGVRGGYNRISTSSGDDEDDGEPFDGFFVSPTLGGSYFFSDFFSLGGEVEARYTSFSGGDDDFEMSSSTLALRPSLVVRFYF